jgi:hypothetical protein
MSAETKAFLDTIFVEDYTQRPSAAALLDQPFVVNRMSVADSLANDMVNMRRAKQALDRAAAERGLDRRGGSAG